MPLPLALSLVPLAASAFGQFKGAQSNKAIDEFLQNRSSDLDSAFNRDFNKNFLDTDQAKSVIGTLKNQFGTALKGVTGNSIVSGASPEAKVAATDKLKRGFDDSVLRLAGYGTQYQDNLRREKNRRSDVLANQQLGQLGRKSESFTNLAENAGNALPGILGSSIDPETGAFGKWSDLKDLFGSRGSGKVIN